MENQPIIETKPVNLPTCLDRPVTLRTLRKWSKANEKWAMLTCYDATTARWMADAGLPTMLVGDTAAEMILGYDSTIHAPLDFLITLTAAVKRGAPNVFVMGDMPFLSYQVDEPSAIQNAGRFLTEGNADAVKLEVDGKWVDRFAAICNAGIAAVAHLGSKPQQAKQTGGYTTAGRSANCCEHDCSRCNCNGGQCWSIDASCLKRCQKRSRKLLLKQHQFPSLGAGLAQLVAMDKLLSCKTLAGLNKVATCHLQNL